MIPTIVGCITILGTGIGAATWVDGRYETRAHMAQVRQDDERGRLETQLEVYELKLQLLEAKPAPTADDAREIKYLEEVIAKIRQRLAGLQ